MSVAVKFIRPQEGYQMLSLSSPADIVIGGGSAGSGKTWCMLLECMRNVNIPNFGAVVFRRTTPQIKGEGGLWDASYKMYSQIRGAVAVESRLEWHFGNRAKVKFSHLEHKSDIYSWQGAEIPLICFDELTHFDKEMFFYLLTRNRSTCGVAPYVRATCNPDPDSWVYELIKWWIGADGLPIEERRGVVRYFTVANNKYIWGDTIEEVMEKGGEFLQPQIDKGGVSPKDLIKSLTFIGGSIYENKELIKINPGYLGSLSAQDEQTKARLLNGNWHVKVSGQDIYDFYKFANIFTNKHVEVQLRANKGRLKNLLAMQTQTPLDTSQLSEVRKLQRLTRKCITADIALKGSDKLVIMVWEGKMMIDIMIVDKSTGPKVIAVIKGMAIKHKIPNSEIVYDNDGVGQFVGGEGGFIDGAIEFNNGSTAIGREAYNHLKSQCYFKSGAAVYNAEYYIPESVIQNGREIEISTRLIDEDTTLEAAMKQERKAIKQGKPDDDGKLQVIKKSEMKTYLDGKSPDLLDAFMMREYFELHEAEILETSDDVLNGINW